MASSSTAQVLQRNQQHEEAGRKISTQVLLAELKACIKTRDLHRGKQVHEKAVECGQSSDAYIASALINMYAKCGSMVDARQVFDSINHPNVVFWNVLLLGYADNGQRIAALDLFTRMKAAGPAPNSVTFVAVLKACTSLTEEDAECVHWVKQVHNLAVEIGCHSSVYVESALINMYAKCGNMADASQVFQCMKDPNVVSWNALILGCAENGQALIALNLFTRMPTSGPAPSSVTFLAALKACTALAWGRYEWFECRKQCKAIHNLAVENGFDSDVYLQNTLVDMYFKCGSMEDARQVFNSTKDPNVVAWNALIVGYADNRQGFTALDSFTKMKHAPNSVTFLAALKACTSLAVRGDPECGDRAREIHNLIVESGCDSHAYVLGSLIDMFAKCGSMRDARQVFDSVNQLDVVAWNALIMGYAENGQSLTALDLFKSMKTLGDPAPDSVTYAAALNACTSLGALEFGRTIHSDIDSGNHLDLVLVTCLVDFYAKCGSLVDAKNVFDLHCEARDLITWNAFLGGFSSCGDDESAFRLFEGMQDAGFKPDSITFSCILTCCSHAGLVEKGTECFEAMSSEYGVVPDVEHYSCMVDILGRANKLDEAMALLQLMPCSTNYVTWTTVLDASRKWKNVAIARLAFQSLTELNDADATAFVLMGQLFRSRGMLQEHKIVMRMRKRVVEVPGETCWTNELGDVHKFLVELETFS